MLRTLNLAVIGLGHRGLSYLRILMTMNEPGVKIVALVDPNSRARQAALKIVKGKHTPWECETVEGMLAVTGKMIHAAIVATPPQHRDAVVTLLQWPDRKIAVFCSAPLTTNFIVAQDIEKRLEKTQHVVVVDHWTTTAGIVRVKELFGIGVGSKLCRIRIVGHGGHARKVELVRSGSQLLNLAFEFTGPATKSHVIIPEDDGSQLLAYLKTANGIPIVVDFLTHPSTPFDGGKLAMLFEGETGRIYAIGSFLENVYSHPLVFDTTSQDDRDLITPHDRSCGMTRAVHGWADEVIAGAWPVRKGESEKALLDPNLNPTFKNLTAFFRLVRGDPTAKNPCPIQKAMPVVKSLVTLLVQFKRKKKKQ